MLGQEISAKYIINIKINPDYYNISVSSCNKQIDPTNHSMMYINHRKIAAKYHVTTKVYIECELDNTASKELSIQSSVKQIENIRITCASVKLLYIIS